MNLDIEQIYQNPAQVDRFLEDWDEFEIVELSNEVLRHPLKAPDAIHLASALWAKEFLSTDIVFVVSDRNLKTVATEEGLRVFNPAEAGNHAC